MIEKLMEIFGLSKPRCPHRFLYSENGPSGCWDCGDLIIYITQEPKIEIKENKECHHSYSTIIYKKMENGELYIDESTCVNCGFDTRETAIRKKI